MTKAMRNFAKKHALPSTQKIMYIMRGLPGSGKSTLARKLAGDDGVICSADDFFMEAGKYNFNPEALPTAHEACYAAALFHVTRNTRVIVIDNTNHKAEYYARYEFLGKSNGYKVIFKEPNTPWAFDPEMCAVKTIHDVPLHFIEKMMEDYEQQEN